MIRIIIYYLVELYIHVSITLLLQEISDHHDKHKPLDCTSLALLTNEVHEVLQ